MLRKILSFLLIAFLAYYVVTNPGDSASFVRTVLTGAGDFASALAGGGTK